MDAYSPRQIAKLVEAVGVKKARADALTLLVLGILAGAFISLGSLFYLVVVTESSLGFGPTQFLGGLSFSLGLILVLIGGAELFTGNNLLAMAWASRRIGTLDVLRNWMFVYVGNVLGCLGTVLFVLWADLAGSSGEGWSRTATEIARAKASLSTESAFGRGILCNALVCLGVWLAMGGRSVSDKILAIVLPITAFVAIGTEHSIANWFFLPLGMSLDPDSPVSIADVAKNLAAVTGGNVVGGTLLVAGVYWVAYLRQSETD